MACQGASRVSAKFGFSRGRFLHGNPLKFQERQEICHFTGEMDAALNWLFFSSGTTKSTRILSPGFSFDKS